MPNLGMYLGVVWSIYWIYDQLYYSDRQDTKIFEKKTRSCSEMPNHNEIVLPNMKVCFHENK